MEGGEVVRLRKWRNNNMFENLEGNSEILLSLDSKYLAHRTFKNRIEIFDIENEIASIYRKRDTFCGQRSGQVVKKQGLLWCSRRCLTI